MEAVLLDEVRRLKAAYAKHGQHTGSKYALRYAREALANPYPEVEWDPGFGLPSGTVEHDEFDVTVEVEYDPCPDLSFLGEFSTEWSHGAIDIEKDEEYNYNRHDYPYFIPANPAYRNLDWRLMKRILRDELVPVSVRVTASKAGIELGYASLGGCFWEDGKEDELAYDYLPDLVHEAVEEAREAVRNICPHCGK